jgi:NADPH:quinone reductase-like Zn-dependent oxidoreductase
MQVAASSVNPVDYKIRGASPFITKALPLPKVTGSDGSGVVMAAPREFSRLHEARCMQRLATLREHEDCC